MKVVLASRNRKKIKEVLTLLRAQGGALANVTVLSLDDIGYEGEIEENGTSFRENALIKASVPAELGYIGIADDSGLAVDALDGAPGVYSARYAGEPCDDEKNNQKLLSQVLDRYSRIVSVIVDASIFSKHLDIAEILCYNLLPIAIQAR